MQEGRLTSRASRDEATSLNASFIGLGPKKGRGTWDIRDFRPIKLIGSVLNHSEGSFYETEDHFKNSKMLLLGENKYQTLL